MTRQDNNGWFKSRYSPSQGTCVEVRFVGALAQIRDTKDDGTGPIIDIDIDQWPTFLDEVVGVAPAGSNRTLRIQPGQDGAMELHTTAGDIRLTFDREEWAAFAAGAADGQFAPVATASR